MALEIVKSYMEDCPACRFIGKRYTPADSVNGSYGHKWGEWWADDYFTPLEKLPHLPIVGDSTMAAMHVVNGEVEYWIGFFCPADAEAPEGYEAIGYASVASVKDTVKALTVDGVAPTEATIKDGSYVVQRPFVLVTKTDTPLSDAAFKFFTYITSADACDIISAAGVVPAYSDGN